MAKVLTLLALLVGAEAQFALATLDIVWRTLVLSFDSPASQWTDAIASDGTVSSDGGREAREAVRHGTEPRRFCAVRSAARRDSHWLGSRLTRSPPSSPLA
ncbi:MAG: hypothetical protein HYU41_22730 [Candidatus Rokubacteria bacterium]|nr:hypothetical protein [Candidatus Rokubacteria bacterium]